MDHKETAMNHILLDKQDEAVKRFFLSLTAEIGRASCRERV